MLLIGSVVLAAFPTIEVYSYHEKPKGIPRRLQPFEDEASPLGFERKFFRDDSIFNKNRSIHGNINEWSPKL